MSEPLGPNVKRLIVAKMALLAIPPGSGDRSLGLGVSAMTTPGNPADLYHKAHAWVKAAIEEMMMMPDCPWNTDEEIAGDILKTLKERGLI